DPAARLEAARALAVFADERNERNLAAWAYGLVATLDPADERSRLEAERLAPLLERQDEEILFAERAADPSADVARREALAELVRVARSAPGASRLFASAIVELARGRVDDESLFAEAIQAAERVSDLGSVARLCRDRLAVAGAPA